MGFLSKLNRRGASASHAAHANDQPSSPTASSNDMEKQQYAKVAYITPRVVIMGILVSMGGLIFGMFEQHL